MKQKAKKAISLLAAIVGVEAVIFIQPTTTVAQKVGPGCISVVKRPEMEDLIDQSKAADAKAITALMLEVKRLFGLSCQATRDGLADDENTKRSLKLTEIGLTASKYDGLKRSSTPGAEPYSWVTADQITAFYAVPDNDAEFSEYFRMATLGSPTPDAATTLQARNYYARIMVAYAEAKKNGAALLPDFDEKVGWVVKFQQSLALAETYLRQRIQPKIAVTDAQIDTALKTNRLYSTAAKRLKANGILKRVLAGGDFAKLATQYTEDPGSKAQGGLYTAVPKGAFEKNFENAALSVKPGETVKSIVETPFGFHIIRLEKRNETNGSLESFDVRHILVSTMVGTGDQRLPLREFVREKLETRNRDTAIAAILLKNPVAIEYRVPLVKPAPKAPVKRGR